MANALASAALGGRAELQTWYLSHLRPKVADAVTAGVVPPAAAADLDRQLRAFLGLRDDGRQAARSARSGPSPDAPSLRHRDVPGVPDRAAARGRARIADTISGGRVDLDGNHSVVDAGAGTLVSPPELRSPTPP